MCAYTVVAFSSLSIQWCDCEPAVLCMWESICVHVSILLCACNHAIVCMWACFLGIWAFIQLCDCLASWNDFRIKAFCLGSGPLCPMLKRVCRVNAKVCCKWKLLNLFEFFSHEFKNGTYYVFALVIKLVHSKLQLSFNLRSKRDKSTNIIKDIQKLFLIQTNSKKDSNFNSRWSKLTAINARNMDIISKDERIAVLTYKQILNKFNL